MQSITTAATQQSAQLGKQTHKQINRAMRRTVKRVECTERHAKRECASYEIFVANLKYDKFHLNFLSNEEILSYQINQINNQHRLRLTKITKANSETTSTSTSSPSLSSCCTNNSAICAQTISCDLVTQLISRLCLIIVGLLALLTASAVCCVDCQQIMPSMSSFGKILPVSVAAADDRFAHMFQPQRSSVEKHSARYTTKNAIASKGGLLSNGQFNDSFSTVSHSRSYSHTSANGSSSVSVRSISDVHSINATIPLQMGTRGDNYHVAKQYLYKGMDADDSLQWSAVESNNLQWKSSYSQVDNQQLLELVMSGLNLDTLPDMNMVNISQMEYATKYREYLRRVHERAEAAHQREPTHYVPFWTIGSSSNSIHVEKMRAKRELPIEFMLSETSSKITRRHSKSNFDTKTIIRLHFPLIDGVSQLTASEIEEANIRLMILYSPELALKTQTRQRCGLNRTGQHSAPKKRTKHLLSLKVYQLIKHGKRQWVDGQKLEVNVEGDRADDTHSKWLQFDVTKAVKSWISGRENLGLEVQCDNCRRLGARILLDDDATQKLGNGTEKRLELSPVLNIVGRLGVQRHELRIDNKLTHNGTASRHNTLGYEKHTSARNNKCKSNNQRCCRHSMEVVFKDLKGFEFIIQPKVFDAGYCQGRCPPRYNPANHHALLQGLIWKQNHKLAPRLCCAPSKLVELEVLHVDEKDSQKLKISTWSNMKVIDCACT